MPRDKFLKEQIVLDDGWIPIATMLKFARLSQLTNSPPVIFAALKKSTSGLMEVDETNAKIRRSKEKPIPEESEEYVAEVKSRTIYCKGLPKEGMTIDKLLDFFKSFPTVLNIKVSILSFSVQTIIREMLSNLGFRCVTTGTKKTIATILKDQSMLRSPRKKKLPSSLLLNR